MKTVLQEPGGHRFESFLCGHTNAGFCKKFGDSSNFLRRNGMIPNGVGVRFGVSCQKCQNRKQGKFNFFKTVGFLHFQSFVNFLYDFQGQNPWIDRCIIKEKGEQAEKVLYIKQLDYKDWYCGHWHINQSKSTIWRPSRKVITL